MHHYVPIEPPELPGSHALISDSAQVDTAVVFVHGFLGDPTKTWLGFQALVDQHRGWEDSDLFFLAHDSVGQSIREAAETLRLTLRWIAGRPPELRRAAVDSLPDWLAQAARPAVLGVARGAYRKLVLVGHSQGGLVLRTALLGIGQRHLETLRDAAEPVVGTGIADSFDGATTTAPLELRAAVRLFAPALSGTHPAGLYGLFLTAGKTAWLAEAVRGGSPSFEELKPGSALQAAVRAGTERLARRLDALPSFRADVLWADRDEVVIDQEYGCDHRRGRAEGKDHAEVCKPSLAYPAPLELVRDGRP